MKNKTINIFLFLASISSLIAYIPQPIYAATPNQHEQWLSSFISLISKTNKLSKVIIAAPDGNGSACTTKSPCSITTATSKNLPGSIILLRNGIYIVNSNIYFSGGNSDAPIIYKSYPGEWAILDGSAMSPGEPVFIRTKNNFSIIRDIEIRNMPRQGLYINGNNNIIDGVHSHHNTLTGIQIFSDYNLFPYGEQGSNNTVTYSTVNNNSDVGFNTNGLNDGNNADGISISSGNANRITHNLVYENSDDGIDAWRSTNTYIAYNTVSKSGSGNGNGMGIKAGGTSPSTGTIAEHNLSYNNLALGLTFNSGTNQIFRKNTLYNNALSGFCIGPDTLIERNIGLKTICQPNTQTYNNSWQKTGTVEFKSLDPESDFFLNPVQNSNFTNIGAFADNEVTTFKYRKITIIGDSTVHNTTNGESGWGDKIQLYGKSPSIIINKALSGRSSKSFYENNWNDVLSTLEPGAILLIQFGHNDSNKSNPAKYTNPGTSPSYNGTYRKYLTAFVTEARKKGARPYLITPVSRMKFVDGQ